ncbi:MAG: solute carrier family 23 protein [Candidatus Izemoplasmatales bacterium]|nr:solute carrier family 23 protein [bacterium]MDZ4196197.1 solute carrier family 23 protein [Candidatus Izemoplasmatales bacterium]
MEKLLLEPNQKPKTAKWILLSLQHVFAMFGATVLVPLLTGLDVGVTLIASGVGTLIYILCTKGKVPVYLGSSFAYIGAIVASALQSAKDLGIVNPIDASLPLDLSVVSQAIRNGQVSFAQVYASAFIGLMVVGIIYIIVALIIRFVGSAWLKKLLPPVVIGPMIIIIGLGLAPVAINSSGLSGASGWQIPATLAIVAVLIGGLFVGLKKLVSLLKNPKAFSIAKSLILPVVALIVLLVSPLLLDVLNIELAPSHLGPIVAIITLAAVVIVSLFGKGFVKVVPFLIAVVIGYLAAVQFNLLDLSTVFANHSFLQVPSVTLFGTYAINWAAVLTFAPISFVTIAEHIGDHSVLGEICQKDFITDPGLDKTLLGDGIATLFAGAIGGPANTTYGENTGVVAMTRVGSVYVTGLAAIFAIVLGFFGYVQAFILSIPWAVIGGMTIVLYGLIAGNGVKVLIKAKTNLGNMKNLIVMATMLVLGLGGAAFSSGNFTLTGMSLAAVVGIILNLVLPDEVEAKSI